MSEISWSYKKISLEYFKDKYIEYYEYCSKYFVRVGDKHNAVDILETKDKAVADKFVKNLEAIIAASVSEGSVKAGYEKYVYRVVLGFDIEVYKTTIYDVFINGVWFKSSNSLKNIQSGVFEYILKQIDLENRTTENVMRVFFDVQLLISVCEQEFEEQ